MTRFIKLILGTLRTTQTLALTTKSAGFVVTSLVLYLAGTPDKLTTIAI